MNKNLAKLFFIISMFFGTIILFLIPAFNAPDEDSHFLYAYHISQGDIYPKVENNKLGFDVPDELNKFIDSGEKMINNFDDEYTYEEMYNDQFIKKDYSKTSFNSAVIASSPVIAYIAPAIGIRVATLFSNNPMVLLQFARFFSLLLYSIIGYFAIKITPKFKKSFFVILLMPLSIFLRSMVSYDGLILVVEALVLANIFRLSYKEKVKFTNKDLILFIICGFILFNIKMVYSICFLGILFIDDNVFDSKKNKIKSIIYIIGAILILTIIRKIPYTLIDTTNNVEGVSNLEFVLNNKLEFLKILVYNVIHQLRYQNYMLIGVYGSLDVYMPVLFVFIYETYLFFTIIFDASTEEIKAPLSLKIGYIILIILVIFGIYSIMYISWTPKVSSVGGHDIQGVQGRYFLPLLLLLPVILSNNIFKNKFNKLKDIYNNNFHYITVLSLILVTIVIFIRYYC